jgi:hypothetical protein
MASCVLGRGSGSGSERLRVMKCGRWEFQRGSAAVPPGLGVGAEVPRGEINRVELARWRVECA